MVRQRSYDRRLDGLEGGKGFESTARRKEKWLRQEWIDKIMRAWERYRRHQEEQERLTLMYEAADLERPEKSPETLEAEEEIICRYRAIPPERHARLIAAMGQGSGPACEHAQTVIEEEYGITDELWERAIGPDADELSREHQLYRMGLVSDRYWETEEGKASHAALEALVRKHPEIILDRPEQGLPR